MRKIALSVLGLFLLLTCDNGGMENNTNNTEDQKYYLTISYHSEGHTEGEVPIDDNRYEIMDLGKEVEKYFMPRYYAEVTIQDQGTLKKRYKSFIRWNVFDPDAGLFLQYPLPPTSQLPAKYTFKLGQTKNSHFEFHAYWD